MKTVGRLLMLVLLTGCPKGQTSLVTVYPKDGLDPATKTFIENELRLLLAATEHPNFDITVTLQQPEVGTPVAMTSPKGGYHNQASSSHQCHEVTSSPLVFTNAYCTRARPHNGESLVYSCVEATTKGTRSR
jgi:hypothetical protein